MHTKNSFLCHNHLASTKGELAFFLISIEAEKDLESKDEQEIVSKEDVPEGGNVAVDPQQQEQEQRTTP
ncbi:hypothetical protein L6452_37279 [Arctium lappa]|uniref:Uncharacterized protein n=1 Tax=Arctium lappa TaxID=4217 RepID=A0ACB8Y374_ARCLA|nr:hypothetical protein L6452_37279 [Arctium lappa]